MYRRVEISRVFDKLGYVGVTPLIVDGSLRENLIYGNKNNIKIKK